MSDVLGNVRTVGNLIHVTTYSTKRTQDTIGALHINIHDLTMQRHVLYICGGSHAALHRFFFNDSPLVQRERELFIFPVFNVNIIDLLNDVVTVVRF